MLAFAEALFNFQNDLKEKSLQRSDTCSSLSSHLDLYLESMGKLKEAALRAVRAFLSNSIEL